MASLAVEDVTTRESRELFAVLEAIGADGTLVARQCLAHRFAEDPAPDAIEVHFGQKIEQRKSS